MAHRSIGVTLRQRLEPIVAKLRAFAGGLAIEPFDRGGNGIVFVGLPDYFWSSRTTAQEAEQLVLKREYDEWYELLTVILRGAPEAVAVKLKKADDGFRTWIELSRNFSLSADRARNQRAIDECADGLYDVISIIESFVTGEVVLTPDTNTILEHPDPVAYRVLAEADTFTFLLLPSVLVELDELKINHRNPEIREKAKDAIRRIKGWRRQGSLRTGVIVDRTITVRAEHAEPNMPTSLSWLDPQVRDDRIIAGALAVEAREPGAAVVLVTSDINLQNKADAAALQVAEFPDI